MTGRAEARTSCWDVKNDTDSHAVSCGGPRHYVCHAIFVPGYSQYPVICAPVICHILYNWEDHDRQLPREPSTNLAIVFWNAAQTVGIGKTLRICRTLH